MNKYMNFYYVFYKEDKAKVIRDVMLLDIFLTQSQQQGINIS